jgi:ribonuclease E
MPDAPAVSESDEAAYATGSVDPSVLFNVDDPLGDVLDASTVEAAPAAPFESASAIPLDDAPQVEATAAEMATPSQAPAASADSPMDYAVEFPAEPFAAPEPLTDSVAFEMNAPAVDPMPAAETGFGLMQVETDDAAEAAPRAAENNFTTASMWTTEDARFAAIDIEATPVEEAAESAASEAPAEAAAHRVEDDTSAYITQAEKPAAQAAPVEEAAPAPAVEKKVEAAVAEMTASAPAVQESQTPSAAAGGQLSPALIDEIVRRVVAQMSESVVREIAWEVVPDCVERVIKEMTAQEVAKR